MSKETKPLTAEESNNPVKVRPKPADVEELNYLLMEKQDQVNALSEELSRLIAENERLKKRLKELLPEDCVEGYGEVKFCCHRQGDGNMCKHCAD